MFDLFHHVSTGARVFAGVSVDSRVVRILCVATKLPWPPRDGGRLVLALTLEGLAAAGHDIHLVAPTHGDADENVQSSASPACTTHAIFVQPMRWSVAAFRALLHGRALSVARHHRVEVEHAVAECIAQFRPDIVHAEQLQALANCSSAKKAGIPIVLRMQNVESEIWRQTLSARFGVLPFSFLAKRMRIEEKHALAAAARTLTLTEDDACMLSQIGSVTDRARINVCAPPFPHHLPSGPSVTGEPAIVLSGSSGWWPNTQGTHWFLRHVAPELCSMLPRAVVHVFGGDILSSGPNIVSHAAPVESIVSFPEGAIAAVPLFVGSGIRMRILEAWARGIAVVATSIATRGLDVVSGRELLIADTPADFCEALRLLAGSRDVRDSLIAGGRAYLATRHDPVQATRALLDVYQQTISLR